MNRFPPFPLFEQDAASLSAPVDRLFFAMLALSAVVIMAVLVALIGFSIRYRSGSTADRSDPPDRSVAAELIWTTVPLLAFVGFFVWSANLYRELYTPPNDALQIMVVAKQWMWKLQHPNGRREIDELHVPVDRTVKLLMTSEDVIHSFFVPAFRTKQDVLPGRYVSLWFRAEKPGIYPLFCAEYCGTSHSHMGGRVVVLETADYTRWLNTGQIDADGAAQGGRLFAQLGCIGCHGDHAAVAAPALQGVFGSTVRLQGGATVAADERYIRDSILRPDKDIVAGYPPIMPSFDGRVDDAQLTALIAYVRSLGGEAGR